jgi:hypothetical protein
MYSFIRYLPKLFKYKITKMIIEYFVNVSIKINNKTKMVFYLLMQYNKEIEVTNFVTDFSMILFVLNLVD